jgi:hypothetical protein
MDATSTVLGWSVLLLSGGGLYWYYTKEDRNRRPFRARNIPAAAARVAKDAPAESRPARERRREQRRATGVSDTDVRKRAPAQESTISQSQSFVKDEEEREDLSWAKELADKQKGSSLKAPSRNDTRQKTVKQGTANKKAAQMTPSSSTTGGDADDDLSPAVSPSFPADDSQALPSANDVADMLEAPAPAPTTLRLTEPANGIPSKPKPLPRAVQEVDSKKARQNRKKAEEKKLQREADEKARRALEEKQRRTAREARGEPAKNGLAPAKTPSNAWTASNHVTAAPVPATNSQLLDTFSNEAPKANGGKANGGKWWSGDLPSEEEQERILKEQDDSSWNTVVTKKGKKKNKNAEGSVDDDASDTPAPAVQAPVLGVKPTEFSNGTFGALHDDGNGWEVA